MLRNIHCWLPGYILDRFNQAITPNADKKPVHIFLTICDHFEPLWNKADKNTGVRRIKEWCQKYPAIADKFRDAHGSKPKHTFFYPIEEYYPECMDLLAGLCHQGYGEVEVHLHHDHDTGDNLRKTLLDYKKLLFEKHGLLFKDKETGEIKYGFIHGNWALDNSRPDGRWCGVNNEISILQETGCYADFTMPSAPDVTQSAKINSIYYAIDDPQKPKSFNTGIDVSHSHCEAPQVPKQSQSGLLMIQGPLLLNWQNRKWGIFPRIENSAISHQNRVTLPRIQLWLNARVQIKGQADYIFIKLYTHGCQEDNSRYLLGEGLDKLFSYFLSNYNDGKNYLTHFVCAREMVDIIKKVESN